MPFSIWYYNCLTFTIKICYGFLNKYIVVVKGAKEECKEINKAEDNLNEMKEYVYPDFLPVLQILSQDTVKQYNDVKTSGEATVNLNELAEKLITNPVIQKVEVLEGDHMIHLTNAQSIINSIKNFLYSI